MSNGAPTICKIKLLSWLNEILHCMHCKNESVNWTITTVISVSGILQ